MDIETRCSFEEREHLIQTAGTKQEVGWETNALEDMAKGIKDFFFFSQNNQSGKKQAERIVL